MQVITGKLGAHAWSLPVTPDFKMLTGMTKYLNKVTDLTFSGPKAQSILAGGAAIMTHFNISKCHYS